MKRLPWFALMVAVLVFVGAVVAWVLSRPTHEPGPDVTITAPLRRTPPRVKPKASKKKESGASGSTRDSRPAGAKANPGSRRDSRSVGVKSPIRRRKTSSPKTAPDRRRPNTGQDQGQGGQSSQPSSTPPQSQPEPQPVLTVPLPSVCLPPVKVGQCGG